MLDVARKMNSIYMIQPVRTVCKLCSDFLPIGDDFINHGIPYKFCPSCGHLNGKFQDSQDFFSQMYLLENGIEYNSAAYVAQDFISRVQNVYIPKLDFLLENLVKKNPSVLDIGCGAGHFVSACLSAGIDAKGIDVSQTSISFGNHNLSLQYGVRPLSQVDSQNFTTKILESDATVITAIGVIEHIQDLPAFFNAICQSNAKYVFYSVPMASLSVLVENLMPNVFPRHLSADHTHLFTEASLNELNKLLQITPIAEWRFGTDIPDLLRSFLISFQDSKVTAHAYDFFIEKLNSMCDELQGTLDRNHFCSEIHVIGIRNASE